MKASKVPAETTAGGREFQISTMRDWKENLLELRRTKGLTRVKEWPLVIVVGRSVKKEAESRKMV